MELLTLLSETVQDVIRGGWMRQVDFHEEDHRIVWHTDGTGTVETVDHRTLLRFQVEVTCSAVEEANQPIGFVTSKPWSAIPVGWFVAVKPTGPWYEVLGTERIGDAQQVTIRVGDGSNSWLRDPRTEVTCRAGSMTNPLGDAVRVLGDGVEILEDQP